VIAFRLEDMDPDGDGVVNPLDECDYDPDAGDGIYIPGQYATWLGDGTAEAMYSGADGVWTGTEAYIAGVVGDAFAFDGASYVSADLPANSAFTVQLWARADEIQPRNYGLVSAVGPQGFQIDWNASGGYRFATPNGFNRNFGPASTTEFQHLVAVSAGGTSIVLYVNGVQVASGINSNGHTVGDVAIGTNRNRLLHFHGAIDDVRIWHRPLTAAEVAAIYASGPGGVCRGQDF
jgi:hypothetical protein